MAQDDAGTPKRTWRHVAQEISREENSVRVHILIKEMNQLILEEERRKVLQRLAPKPSEIKQTAS